MDDVVGKTYGYPDGVVNAKSLEHKAASKFVKSRRGPASLAAALKHVTEVMESGKKVRFRAVEQAASGGGVRTKKRSRRKSPTPSGTDEDAEPEHRSGEDYDVDDMIEDDNGMLIAKKDAKRMGAGSRSRPKKSDKRRSRSRK